MACGISPTGFDGQVKTILDSVSSAAFLVRVKDRFCCAGLVNECGEDFVHMTLLEFMPGRGFQSSSSISKEVYLHLKDIHRRSLHMTPGFEIVCCGNPISPCTSDHWYFQEDSVVLPRPSLEEDLAFNFVHFFAGAFAGWEQGAMWCKSANLGFSVGQQLAIDQDDVVMTVWREKHKISPLSGPLQPQFVWNPSSFIGILTSVDDLTILHACANRSNIIATLSPPCPTWSRAGKGQGLAHSGGLAFLQALETCIPLQPNLILMECVDDIVNHADFDKVVFFLSKAGYTKVFSEVVPHHQISNHFRSRWLGVWARSDHDPGIMPFKIIPSVCPRLPWNSPQYDFSVPSIWAEQLKLSNSELEVYGNPVLLPAAKRARLSPDAKPSDVIEARFPNGSEPLPTLCASYSNQHMIQMSHLQAKGIFAILEHHPRGVSFFDPARFCALFGACDLLVLPSKLQEAFKCVGNAITVQHGILPILVGLQAVLKQPFDIHALLTRSWSDRMTGFNAVIFHHGDFVILAKAEQALTAYVSPKQENPSSGPFELRVTITCFFRKRVIAVQGQETFAQVLQPLLSGPRDLLRQIALWDNDQRTTHDWTIRRFGTCQSEWTIRLKAVVIGSCSIHRTDSVQLHEPPSFTKVISPTLPFDGSDNDDVTVPFEPLPQWEDGFEQTCQSSFFLCFLQALESTHIEGICDSSLCLQGPDGLIVQANIAKHHRDKFLMCLSDLTRDQGGRFRIVDNTATTCGFQINGLESLSRQVGNTATTSRPVQSFLILTGEHCGHSLCVDNTATTVGFQINGSESLSHQVGNTATTPRLVQDSIVADSNNKRASGVEILPDNSDSIAGLQQRFFNKHPGDRALGQALEGTLRQDTAMWTSVDGSLQTSGPLTVDNTATTCDLATAHLPNGLPDHAPDALANGHHCEFPNTVSSPSSHVANTATTLAPEIGGNGGATFQHLLLETIIQLHSSSQIRAGGHHGYRGFPMTLEAGASIEQRAAYAVDTHGWVATDEMVFVCQLIRGINPEGPLFSGPVYWDVRQSDFDESPFGDFLVADNATTIIPILMQAHWAAVDISRFGDSIHLTIHQVPPKFHLQLVRIIARRLDTTPAKIQFHAPMDIPAPHLCGWNLIAKWINDAQIRDQIPNLSLQGPIPPPDIRDLIELVVTSSMECWRDAHAVPATALLAATLRRSFFHMLFEAILSGLQATEHDLVSAYPSLYIQPPDPPQLILLGATSMNHVIQDKIQQRLEHFQLYNGWMASDEMDHICEYARILNPENLITPACVWCPVRNALVFPEQHPPVYGPFGHIIWPVIYGTHWIQVETYRSHNSQIVNLIVTAPQALHPWLNPLINHVIQLLGAFPASTTITYIIQSVPQNMCGYAVALDIYERMSVSFPPVSPQLQHTLDVSAYAQPVHDIQNKARQIWDSSTNSEQLKAFADYTRTTFLAKVILNRFPHEYFAGGMEGSSPASTSPHAAAAPAAKVDPIWVNDPWKQKGKQKPQQSRWEDLLLSEDHPFKGTDGKAIEQIHRLQASPWRGGIVMSTKAHLADLLHLDPSNHDLVIVLPAAEPASFGTLAPRLQGPHEVVLKDAVSKATYKRLVLVIVVKGKMVYQLPTPTLKFNTIQVAELVLEIDSRLTPSHDFSRYKENPISSFRKLCSAIVQDKIAEIIFYGFRFNHHPSAPKDEFQLQCIAKVPHSMRKGLLEASGRTTLFVRDYLERGQGNVDTSVLPRFWLPTPSDLQTMLIATKDTDGAAGLVITKRGLALRVWSSQIGAARTSLLAGDPRITKDNKDVVPKMSYEASGWPVGTTAANVVEATLQATCTDPNPHFQGCWSCDLGSCLRQKAQRREVHHRSERGDS